MSPLEWWLAAVWAAGAGCVLYLYAKALALRRPLSEEELFELAIDCGGSPDINGHGYPFVKMSPKMLERFAKKIRSM